MTPEENLHIKSLKDRSDIFNYVIDHLLRQGKKSLSKLEEIGEDEEYYAYHGSDGAMCAAGCLEDEEYCAYRGSDGAMCAAGCLIADDEYDKSFEGININSVVTDEKPAFSSLRERLSSHVDMISDLQELHDDYLAFKSNSKEFSKKTKSRIALLRKKWNIK